jgi:cyclophilin family peptidyl-prolyl cis-trans isomerase
MTAHAFADRMIDKLFERGDYTVMKLNVKSLVIGMLIGMLFSGTVVYAGGSQIEVYFKNLRMMFDGVEKSPTDQPVFIYEGSTYVPLRFMSEAMGKLVQYDAEKETVWVGGRKYDQAPEMQIDVEQAYTAIIETNKGSFSMELFAKEAPKTVNNFVFLAKEGYYDGISFHRILKDFVIQGGDPKGNGTGGPGYAFEDELPSADRKYEPGIVAMANSGPNTNGSQFFICTGEESNFLNDYPYYSIFGKVIEGMDIVQQIASTPVEMDFNSGDMSVPTEEVKIISIKIQ